MQLSDLQTQHRPSFSPRKNPRCFVLVKQLDPLSKPSLLAWEQGVDNRFNTSVDQSFEDLVGDTEQKDGTIALWVLYRFVWLWDRNYKCSSPDFGNFEFAQAEREEGL